MPVPVNSLWTPEQIGLTAAIVVPCLLLIVFGRRMRTRGPGHESANADERSAVPHGHMADSPRWRRAERAALVVVLVAVGAFLVARGGDPVGVRPDSWSDANVLVAGRNYAREGLLAHWGASQNQVVTDRNPSDPFFIYTQYPVGCGLINGLWQIAGVTSVRVRRLLPAACSLAALWLWFRLFQNIAGRAVATVATITMATSYAFLAYADNLHFHAYGFLTSIAAMHSYVRALRPDESHRGGWFLATALLMFVTACLTWEYHIWMVLFIALYALLFPCPVRRLYLAVLALPLLAALTLQVAQRRLSVDAGGIDPAARAHVRADGFLKDVYRRTLGFAEAADTPAGLTLTGYPHALLLRYYKFYGIPALAMAAMLLVLLSWGGRVPWRVREWSPAERLMVILLAAGLGWWLVMLQHTAVHPHVMRQGLAGYALTLALLWVRCGATLRLSIAHSMTRAAALFLGLVLLYPQLEGLVTDLRVHYQSDFRDARQRGDAGPGESRQMLALRDVVPPGGIILTNHARLPLWRLWLERPVYSGATYRFPPTDPEHSTAIMELRFNHLRQLYHDDLPPLYYIYHVTTRDAESAFAADSLLRFLLLGNLEGGPVAWNRASPIVARGWATGKSDDSFCPIVARADNLLVFRMDPAVPLLRKAWKATGFPTAGQFGPAR